MKILLFHNTAKIWCTNLNLWYYFPAALFCKLLLPSCLMMSKEFWITWRHNNFNWWDDVTRILLWWFQKILPCLMTSQEICFDLMTWQEIVSFLVALSCGGSASENCTYLVQFTTNTLTSPCTYKICPFNTKICRLRFDFQVRTL